MTRAENIEEALDALKGGFYGKIKNIDEFVHPDYYLIRTEIADAVEEWEVAEYHLLNIHSLQSHYLALCDGYNGIEIKMTDSNIAELLGKGTDIKKYLQCYEITGDLLAAAKEAETVEANEDFDGECRVWITYYYSAGTLNRPNDDFARDDNGDTITFDDYAAASEWVDAQTSGTYYLRHGEMGAPSYKIVEA